MARYGRWGPVRGRVRIRKSVSGLGLALVRIRLSGDPHCPALALIGQNQPARGWFWAGDWLAGRCENELIPKLVFFFIIILFFFLHFDIIIFILQRKSTREVYAVQNRALNMRDKPGWIGGNSIKRNFRNKETQKLAFWPVKPAARLRIRQRPSGRLMGVAWD